MSPRTATRRCLLLYGWLLLACLPAQAGQQGGWRLAAESSPYLQMHADNPVEWYPWGEEALARARRENKPLFISVGYFTCHWCHVMARESFGDAGIAALLNTHFISIKVDREQRPDLDAAYMDYLFLSAGHGGWPLTVWATPDGKPFLGGTYYPPDDVRGTTGLRSLLQKLAALWATDEEYLRTVAGRAAGRLAVQASGSGPAASLDAALPRRARQALAAGYDELQGGFGDAPKFPQPACLLFLLQDDTAGSREMALNTLDHLLAGGIHDRLAGGLHRYAVDAAWRVPHFEKMLYDQALTGRALLAAWRLTGAVHYRDALSMLLDFVLRDMRAPGGGFYSALAADCAVQHAGTGAHQEGACYTWDWQQLQAALGDGELLDWAVQRFGLAAAGNAVADPLDEMQGRNVLYDAQQDAALSSRAGIPLSTGRQRTAQVMQRLLDARNRRPPAPVDDKIVTAWNGYLITTLAEAGRVLDEPRYLDAAVAAADFICKELYDAPSQTLYRDWRDGVRGAVAFNEDYAALAEGLLALYRVSGERRWLLQAEQLVRLQWERFADQEHGGYYRAAGQHSAWMRDKPLVDGAAVSSNAVTLRVLLALARLTGESDYRERALATALWAAGQLPDEPELMPYALLSWPELLEPEAGAGQ